MIDFSCCEVKRAFEALYSDNEVLSVNPIVKSANQSTFLNDGKTVYYGAFQNPDNTIGLSYRDLPVVKDGVDLLFNKVTVPKYDTFSGYEIRLKNVLTSLDDRQVAIVLDDSWLNGWPVDVELNGTSLSLGPNYFPYSEISKGVQLISNAVETELTLDSGGTGAQSTLNITEADIIDGGEGVGYFVEVFLVGFS